MSKTSLSKQRLYGQKFIDSVKADRPVTELNTLVKKGASLTEKDSQGRTALFCAIEKNDVTTVSFLTGLYQKGHDIGINVLCETNAPKTPLHVAAFQRSEIIINLLLMAGAKTGVNTPDGMNALHFALYGWHIENAESVQNRDTVAITLIKAGVNPNVQMPSTGFTATHILAGRNTFKDGNVPQWVLHSDLSQKDNEGRTPVDLARLRNKGILAQDLEAIQIRLEPKLKAFDTKEHIKLQNAISGNFAAGLSQLKPKQLDFSCLMWLAPEELDKKMTDAAIFLHLPQEILAHIVSFLSPQDLLALGQACKTLYHAFMESKQVYSTFQERYPKERHALIDSFVGRLEEEKKQSKSAPLGIA